MAEHFAERFIDHRNIGLAPQEIPEFPLNHAEGGFHVRSISLSLTNEIIQKKLEEGNLGHHFMVAGRAGQPLQERVVQPQKESNRHRKAADELRRLLLMDGNAFCRVSHCVDCCQTHSSY